MKIEFQLFKNWTYQNYIGNDSSMSMGRPHKQHFDDNHFVHYNQHYHLINIVIHRQYSLNGFQMICYKIVVHNSINHSYLEYIDIRISCFEDWIDKLHLHHNDSRFDRIHLSDYIEYRFQQSPLDIDKCFHEHNHHKHIHHSENNFLDRYIC